MGKLDGKVAFVTGAAMGNGAGIAHVFAELGRKYYLLIFQRQFMRQPKYCK